MAEQVEDRIGRYWELECTEEKEVLPAHRTTDPWLGGKSASHVGDGEGVKKGTSNYVHLICLSARATSPNGAQLITSSQWNPLDSAVRRKRRFLQACASCGCGPKASEVRHVVQDYLPIL